MKKSFVTKQSSNCTTRAKMLLKVLWEPRSLGGKKVRKNFRNLNRNALKVAQWKNSLSSSDLWLQWASCCKKIERKTFVRFLKRKKAVTAKCYLVSCPKWFSWNLSDFEVFAKIVEVFPKNQTKFTNAIFIRKCSVSWVSFVLSLQMNRVASIFN